MGLPRVELEIGVGQESWGRLVLELDDAKAPKTVANFLKYVDAGYYNGTIFHRVIPTFMVQGGGYTTPAAHKIAGLLPPVENEAKSGLKNLRGTIAMARTSEAHSATAQFFINVVDNAFLNHPGQDGWGYCAFGQVVEGLEVVDRIRNAPTQSNPQMGESSQPVQPPMIRTARRAAAT